MLFSEVIGGRYRVFSRMKDDEKARNIGIVKYIETLASMAGVDIMNWDCQTIFGSGTGNKLVDDKNEVNRRFFEEVEKIAAAAPPPTDANVITDQMRQALRAAESRHVMNLMAGEQARADSQLNSAMSHYREFEKYVKQAGEHFAAVRRLASVSANLEEQIKIVSAGSFWAFAGIVDATVSFTTRTDIVLSHKNQAAGIDIVLNFGKMKATFSLADFTVRVHPLERNIYVNGHYHPHINGSGGVCWGTASATATRQLSMCQIVEPMTILATVLSNYNSSSPYASMERFQEVVGTPEEQDAREAMDTVRNEVAARMRDMDFGALDVNRRRVPAVMQPISETVQLAEPINYVQTTVVVTNTPTTVQEI